MYSRRSFSSPSSTRGNEARAQGSFEKYSHYVRQERDQVVLEVGLLEVVFAHVMHMPTQLQL